MLIKAVHHLRPALRLAPHSSASSAHATTTTASSSASSSGGPFFSSNQHVIANSSSAPLSVAQRAPAKTHPAASSSSSGAAGAGSSSSSSSSSGAGAGAGSSSSSSSSSSSTFYPGLGRSLSSTTTTVAQQVAVQQGEDERQRTRRVVKGVQLRQQQRAAGDDGGVGGSQGGSRMKGDGQQHVRFIDLPSQLHPKKREIEWSSSASTTATSGGIESVRVPAWMIAGLLKAARAQQQGQSLAATAAAAPRPTGQLEVSVRHASTSAATPIKTASTLSSSSSRATSSVRLPSSSVGISRDDLLLVSGPRAPRVRRHSTSTAASSDAPPRDDISNELLAAERSLRRELERRDAVWSDRMRRALATQDETTARQLADEYRSSPAGYFSTLGYNLILSAYLAFRAPGDPINDVLATYNEMLQRDVLPDARTYGNVIEALLVRDGEVAEAAAHVQRGQSLVAWWQRVRKMVPDACRSVAALKPGRAQTLQERADEVERLENERNYATACKLAEAAVMFDKRHPMRKTVYLELLKAMSKRKEVSDDEVQLAERLWQHLETTRSAGLVEMEETLPYASTWAARIDVAAKAGKRDDAERAFRQALEDERQGRVSDARQGGEPTLGAMTLHVAALSARFGSPAFDELLQEIEGTSREAAGQPGRPVNASALLYLDLVTAVVERDAQAAAQLFVKALKSNDRDLVSSSQYHRIRFAIVDALLDRMDVPRLADFLEQASVSHVSRPDSETLSRVLTAGIAHGKPDLTVRCILALRLQPSAELSRMRVSEPLLQSLTKHVVDHEHGVRAMYELLGVLEVVGKVIPGTLVQRLQDEMHDRVIKAGTAAERLQIVRDYAERHMTPNSSTRLALTTSDAHLPSLDSPQLVTLLSSFDALSAEIAAGRMVGKEAEQVDDALEIVLAHLAGKQEWREAAAVVLGTRYGPQVAAERLAEMFPSVEESATPVPSDLHLRGALSRALDAHYGSKATITPLAAYAQLKQELAQGNAPHVAAVARLIQSLGRARDAEKVGELYDLGQRLLVATEPPSNRSTAWHTLEDNMLIALCYMGELERAGFHRSQLIESGGVPSADAYAAMISNAKDTTDDASVARELWDESQQLGVKPHLYLFNTIISKLSRARKAEAAIELFQRMKSEGVRPSSVTYGAVINACCRVGDVESATTLFDEMQKSPHFRPRVPPYNTMMQLHLATPSRDLVLHYYNEMTKAGVAPSAHTYKLLLDAYGTIAPIDLAALRQVFRNLSTDPRVQVQGTHWASMIHAIGAVAGDVDEAVRTFQAIESPEPVCWEALFDVFATVGRVDLLETYRSRMTIRPTAYCNNMLIRGYAGAGRIDEARSVFDAMADSPMGVAAPNNHPTAAPSLNAGDSSVVYREPSTYEAMIRAELACGDREAAMALCDRMEARMYPVAVTSRIRALIPAAAT